MNNTKDTFREAYNVKCVVCQQPQTSNDEYGKHLREAHGVCDDCSIGESEHCMERCKERGLFEPRATVATLVERLKRESCHSFCTGTKGCSACIVRHEAAAEIERLRSLALEANQYDGVVDADDILEVLGV